MEKSKDFNKSLIVSLLKNKKNNQFSIVFPKKKMKFLNLEDHPKKIKLKIEKLIWD